MPRFQDWRTQAALCVLFVDFKVYSTLYLLNGGPGLVGVQVAAFALLAISAGHSAVTGRAKARQKREDDSPD